MISLDKAFTIKNGLTINDDIGIFAGNNNPEIEDTTSVPIGSIYIQFGYQTGDSIGLWQKQINTSWGLISSSTLDFNTEHKNLETLLHNIAENNYEEINRDINNKISSVIHWDSISKLKKIREFLIYRTNNKVTQIQTKQYDNNGNLLLTLTQNINRVNNKINNIVWSIS